MVLHVVVRVGSSTFDIHNAYFKCFGTILKQIVGVPMGSPGSPAYAICICMYYEHLFHLKMAQINQTTNNQYNHTNICQGFRYIDDLFAFFAYDKHDKKSFKIAQSIKNILANHTYHPNMTLKEEKHINNSFDFLETTISYKGNTTFDIKHKDKNFDFSSRAERLNHLVPVARWDCIILIA